MQSPKKPFRLDNSIIAAIIGALAIILAAVIAGIFQAHNNTSPTANTSTATVAISATFTPSPTTIPTATSSTPQPLYQENWSQGMDGWIGNAQWSISNGMLLSNGNAQDNNFIVSPYKPTTADYAVEAQIQFLGAAPPSSTPLFGIFVRSGSNEDIVGYDGYIFGNLAKIRRAAVSQGVILNQTSYSLDTSWHTYRVEIKNSIITFFIDNKQMIQAVDKVNTLPGLVGLFDNNSLINVRSFTVLPL